MSEKGRRELTAESRQGLPGSFVRLESGVTHYELRGDADAQPVVLVHGNAAPYVTWDRTVDDLAAAGFRVLRYDLLGHGYSDRPDLATYDRRLYDEQLAQLLSALDITGSILLVGSSQGGSIATCFAAAHPGRVARLALLAPLFDELPGSTSLLARILATPPFGELLMRMLPDRRLADLSDAIVDPQVRAGLERVIVRQLAFAGRRRAILANARGDALAGLTGCYESVRDQGIPVLLTWGTADQKLPGGSMQRLRELIPSLEYHELDGAGHLAHYEFPERVTPILTRFLAGG